MLPTRLDAKISFQIMSPRFSLLRFMLLPTKLHARHQLATFNDNSVLNAHNTVSIHLLCRAWRHDYPNFHIYIESPSFAQPCAPFCEWRASLRSGNFTGKLAIYTKVGVPRTFENVVATCYPLTSIIGLCLQIGQHIFAPITRLRLGQSPSWSPSWSPILVPLFVTDRAVLARSSVTIP